MTLNPSLDRTVRVPALTRGAVLRAEPALIDPGGKGVNVARALAGNGVPAVALLPVGGDDGATLLRLLAAEGVEHIAVPVAGATRSNIAVAEPDGTVTKLNEPGAPLAPAEFAELTARVKATAATASWVVVSGSLPPGMAPEVFAGFCADLVACRAKVAVDTSGPALVAAVSAGVALVKPNRAELAEAVGRPVTGIEDAVEAAAELRAMGAGTVLASLGSQGAVLVDGHRVLVGTAPVDQPRSCVGAGDALLAGYLSAESTADALDSVMAEGMAWAAAAVGLPGSQMPTSANLVRDRVEVRELPAADQPRTQSLR